MVSGSNVDRSFSIDAKLDHDQSAGKAKDS